MVRGMGIEPKKIMNTVVGVSVTIAKRTLPNAESLDKNHDGFVEVSEVPKGVWGQALKAQAQKDVEDLEKAAAGLLGTVVPGLSAAVHSTARNPKFAYLAGDVRGAGVLGGLASGGAGLAQSTYNAIEQRDFSAASVANIVATGLYEFGSGATAGLVGTAVGLAAAAASSFVVTPVVGPVVGAATGFVAGTGTKVGLDWVKDRTVEFGYSLTH